MNYKSFINSSLSFKIFFLIALFFLILISSVNYQNAKNISNSSKWVTHSYQVQMNLQKLHYNLINSESSVRGYIITKDTSYLNQFYKSKSIIKVSLKILKQTISNNKIQSYTCLKNQTSTMTMTSATSSTKTAIYSTGTRCWPS